MAGVGHLKRIRKDACSVAGAVLYTGGVGKSQNALVQGRQLCTQLSILEGSLAEVFRF